MNENCIFAKQMICAKYEEPKIEFLELGYNLFEKPMQCVKCSEKVPIKIKNDFLFN